MNACQSRLPPLGVWVSSRPGSQPAHVAPSSTTAWLRARDLGGAILLVLLAAATTFAEMAQPEEARLRQAKSKCQWFSVPIEVAGLPTNGDAVPLSCPIDFRSLTQELRVEGLVDERSLRLVLLEPPKRTAELPVQFSPRPQPRLKGGQLLPDTSKQVSYPGEYRAGQTPEGGQVAGHLAWLAHGSSNGIIHYRLDFGIIRTGVVVQVPYPPEDFRSFDERNRAMPVRWFPQMQIRPQQPLDGMVSIFDGKELVTSYHTGPSLAETKAGTTSFRRPFLYPVNGVEGVSLTEFGKPHDPTGSHAHHYALWIAHASVEGNDFWSERGGLITHQAFENLEDGPVFSRIVQKALWHIHGTNLLAERRQLTFYAAAGDFRLIDVALELTPAETKPVTFGKTTFGFLAVRVAQSMSVFDGGGEILNSNGDRNEQGAHLKRADWLDQSGPILPGQWAGIALLDAPDNPRHPTGWHCRNDGWAGASFNADQPFTLEPGATLRLRYRVVLHQGDVIAGKVAQRYVEYAANPVIQLGKPQAK